MPKRPNKPQVPNLRIPYNLKGLGERWQIAEHNEAINNPRDVERPLVKSLDAWVDYAAVYHQITSSPLGEDGVTGQYWIDWGKALRGLLGSYTGRLICGHVDTFIVETIRYHQGGLEL